MLFKEKYHDILQITEQIFAEPELGYKEHKTKAKVIEFIQRENSSAVLSFFSTTGIKTTLSNDKPKTVAFIAELDAVYAPTHFQADPNTGAAHNCGHFTQVGIALALYYHLVKSEQYKKFDFNVCFIFIPAEEYLDLAHRKTMIESGEITYYGGKPEAMKLGVFDDIDFSLCVHAIGERFNEPTIEVNCDLAGFLYKKYHFIGKATHAGFDPFSAINAYSASTLFNVALGLLRQQIRDDKMVRFNPIVMQSDMSTNVVPNKVTIGTDLRTISVEYMQEAATMLDRAAKGSALALGAELSIETEMGYLPFEQNQYLNQFVIQAFEESTEITNIIADRGGIAAAGDIGDLNFMMPCIQIGLGGFEGTIHGDDFKMIDPVFVLETFPRFLSQVLQNISNGLDVSQLYKNDYQQYEKLITSIIQEEK